MCRWACENQKSYANIYLRAAGGYEYYTGRDLGRVVEVAVERNSWGKSGSDMM